MGIPSGLRTWRRLSRGVAGVGLSLLAAVVLVGQARCVWGTDKDYLASGDLVALEVSGSQPAAGDTDVSRTDRLALQLTDRVRPESAGTGALRLLDGATEVAAATHVDLLRCEVTLEAASPLAADTSYTLEAEGLVGFGGGAMEDIFSVTFVTGTDASPVAPTASPSFAEVYTTVIVPRCGACHGSLHPPGGLDFSSPDVAEEALLAGRSEFADGAPRYVVPGQHAASYLMHKVLGVPGIWGDPMPLAGDWPADRACGTVDPDLRLLADWIDGL